MSHFKFFSVETRYLLLLQCQTVHLIIMLVSWHAGFDLRIINYY